MQYRTYTLELSLAHLDQPLSVLISNIVIISNTVISCLTNIDIAQHYLHVQCVQYRMVQGVLV